MSRGALPRLLLLLACAAACKSAAPPAPPAPVVVPARLSLTAPPTAAPGAPVALHLDIAGDASKSDLLLMVVAPGPGRAANLPRFLAPGVAPATGPLSFRTATGWSDATAALATGPATQDLSLPLPTSASGEWLLSAALRDAAGNVAALSSAQVLVSAGPALALSIDRLWTAANDPIQAGLTIAAGQGLGLSAWLTLPTGEQLPLAAGASAAAGVVPLLDRALGDHGAGNYGIDARLSGGDGAIVASASAVFTVCDHDGQLTGTAQAGGVPLQLFSANSSTALSVPVAADGSFSAPVPAGDWLVTGAGLQPQLVTVGCEAATTLPGAGPRSRPAADTASTCTPNKVQVLTKQGDSTSASLPAGLASTFVNHVETYFFNAVPGIQWRDYNTQTSLLSLAARQQLTGCTTCDTEALLDGISNQLRNSDFLLEVTLIKFGADKMSVDLRISDYTDGHIIDGEIFQRLVPFAKYADAGDAIMAQMSPGLEAKLRALVPSIKNPRLELTSSPAVLVAGKPVTLTARLSDTVSCALADPGTAIELHELANLPALPGFDGFLHTDATGAATITATVPQTAALARFRATYTDPRGRFTKSAELVSRVDPPPTTSGLSLSSDKVRLAMGDTARMVALLSGHPNATLNLSATRGTVSPASVTTDANGRADCSFLATTGGLATVTLDYAAPPARASTGDSTNTTFWVDTPFTLDLAGPLSGEVHTNAQAPITATAMLDPTTPAVGLPVLFNLKSGSGTLSLLKGTTDENGSAALVFTAPGDPGTTVIGATATRNSFTLNAETEVKVLAPCADCPVVITSDIANGEVPKNGTVHFFANQIVTWSVNGGGKISGNGTFTAGKQGGIYTVTANSQENAGKVGTLDFVVACDSADFGAAHETPPFDGGGTVYPVDVTVNTLTSNCSPVGSTVTVYLPDDQNSAHVEVEVPPCNTLFGWGGPPPVTIYLCTLQYHYQDNQDACFSISMGLQAKGPGIAGLSGGLLQTGNDGSGNCVTTTDLSFAAH